MWSKIEHWGSEHPVMLGLVIFVIGAVLLYALWPAAAPQVQAAQQPDMAGLAASGNALQAAQLQAQAVTHASDNELQAAQAAISGQLEMTKIGAQTSLGVAGIEADVAGQQIIAGRDVALQSSTLTAQVAQAGYTRDLNIATLNAGAATQQAQIAATAALGKAAFDARTAESSYAAQTEQRLITAQSDLIARAYEGLAANPGAGTVQFVGPVGSGQVSYGQAVAAIPVAPVFQPNFQARPPV